MLRYLLPLALLFCGSTAHSRQVQSQQPVKRQTPNKGHQALFDRSFGLSFGVGQGSAYDVFNAELTYVAIPELHLSLGLGISDLTTMLDGFTGKNDARTVAFKARHHIRPVPIFFRADVGALIYSAEGEFSPRVMHDKSDFYLANGISRPDPKEDDGKLQGYTPYASAAVGIYYFWSIGLYLETTLIGFSYAPRTIIMKPKENDDDLREDLTEYRFFGMFGKDFGVNFSIGFML